MQSNFTLDLSSSYFVPPQVEEAINSFAEDLKTEMRRHYLSNPAPLTNCRELEREVMSEGLDIVKEIAKEKCHSAKVEMLDLVVKVGHRLAFDLKKNPTLTIRTA